MATSHIGFTADHPFDGIQESWPHMLRGTSLRTLGAVIATLVVACVIAACWAAPAGAVRPGGSASAASHLKVSKVSPQSCANGDSDEDDGHRKSCGRDDEPQDHQNQSSSRAAASSPASSPEQPEGSHTPKSGHTPKPATSSRAARSQPASSTPPVPPVTTQSEPPVTPTPSLTNSTPVGTVGAAFPAAGLPTTPALQVAPIDTVGLPHPTGTGASEAASAPGAPATFPSASSAGGVPLPRLVRLGERPLLGVDSPLLIGAEIAVFTLAVGAMVATAGHRGRRTH